MSISQHRDDIGNVHEGVHPHHVLLFNHDDVTNCILRSQKGTFEYSVTTVEGQSAASDSEARATELSFVTTVSRGDVVRLCDKQQLFSFA